MLHNRNIEMIETVAAGLGDVLPEVVFVGGAVASVYIDDPAAFHVRPTKDVDCIIELTGRRAFSQLEEKLRTRGFGHDTSDDAPICRWVFEGILVDVMPVDSRILGFSNQWYKDGIRYSEERELPNGIRISVLSLPYFIATKIEAFLGREEEDFRISHDMEDIVSVLDGLLTFDGIRNAPDSVRTYLQSKFRSFLESKVFIEAVSSHIEHGRNPVRTKRVIDFLKEFGASP